MKRPAPALRTAQALERLQEEVQVRLAHPSAPLKTFGGHWDLQSLLLLQPRRQTDTAW